MVLLYGVRNPTIAFILIQFFLGDLIMETNNISTIATFAAICLTTIMAYFGYTVDQAQATTVIMGVITLIIAIWSSKNPNTFKCLGNDVRPPYDINDDQVLNDEYECDDDGC